MRRVGTTRSLLGAIAMLLLSLPALAAEHKPGLTVMPDEGKANGKKVVLIAGDEEYRSEESLPMLAKILAKRHGFQCTVLFSVDPVKGTIDPDMQTNIPGLEALDSADLMILGLRFRELPDDQMKHIAGYLDAGKPIIALRTSTHAFHYTRNKNSPYAKWGCFANGEWAGGFGQQVLGETWVAHHGDHGKESCRGVIDDTNKTHPVLQGVSDVWGPTDVYTVSHLPKDATVLLHGQVLKGMQPSDPPVEGAKNNPMMPLAWVKTWKSASGKESRIFCTTMGAAVDLENEGLRRLVINASYWATGLDVPASADVAYVGDFKPTFFGFGKRSPVYGLKPSDPKVLQGH